MVMVNAFGWRLGQKLAHVSLPPDILQKIQADKIKLAGMQAPVGLNPGTKAAVKAAIGEAFVSGFRIVLLICAALSVASAAVAWLMVPVDGDRFVMRSPVH
jgi:hypothetical protein